MSTLNKAGEATNATLDGLGNVAKMLPYVVGGLAVCVGAGVLLYSTNENAAPLIIQSPQTPVPIPLPSAPIQTPFNSP